MEELSLINVLFASLEICIVDTMGGCLKSNRLKGRVKTLKILPEKWTNTPSDDDGFTEVQYYNNKGFNVKVEYFQNEICRSSSVYQYNNDLLISEKTTTNHQELITTSEFTYYENNKIKSTKTTSLDEVSKTIVYDVNEEYFFYNSLNNLEKREVSNYSINDVGDKIFDKERYYTLYEYDAEKRIITQSTYDELDKRYSLNESYYNELGEIIKDKEIYGDTYYTSKYNYDKEGSLFSHERFQDDNKVFVSTRKITEKKDKDLISKLGSEFDGVVDDERGRTLWSEKQNMTKLET
jgi:hypothetical protein